MTAADVVSKFSLERFVRALFVIGVGLALAMPGSAIAVDFQSACDTASLCSGVKPGGGRIIRCLKEHKDKVSKACKVALGEFFLNQPVRSPRGGAGGGAAGGGGGGGGQGAGEGPPPEGAGGGGGAQAPDR